MREYLQRLCSTEGVLICNRQEVIVSKTDLMELGMPVSFHRIERLIFKDDVDFESFRKYVGFISHCKYVEVPKSIPRLYTYSSKFRHCTEVVRQE